MRAQFDVEKTQILAEIEAERSHHQRILKDYNRLQQRYENLQDEVEILQSPTVSPNKDQLIGELITINICWIGSTKKIKMCWKLTFCKRETFL